MVPWLGERRAFCRKILVVLREVEGCCVVLRGKRLRSVLTAFEKDLSSSCPGGSLAAREKDRRELRDKNDRILESLHDCERLTHPLVVVRWHSIPTFEGTSKPLARTKAPELRTRVHAYEYPQFTGRRRQALQRPTSKAPTMLQFDRRRTSSRRRTARTRAKPMLLILRGPNLLSGVA